MAADSLFVAALVLILACTAVVVVCARLGIPSVLGYLAAGIVVGPNGAGILNATENVRFLAELGVIFLLFMIGLDFSVPRMLADKRIVFGIGGIQLGLIVILVAVGAMRLGFDWRASLVFAAVVSMSSTAVVHKQLAERGGLHSRVGRIVAGVLLFGDLAALPFLVLVNAWAAAGQGTAARLASVALVFAVVAFGSRPLFKRTLIWVARLRSSESMFLSIFAIAVGTAILAHLTGLSGPTGALLAGMAVGETEFRHQIEEDLRPFRDLLLGLFFVTVGMEVDLSIIRDRPLQVLGWLALFAAKAPIVAAIVRGGGWNPQLAIRSALCLANGGEFGLLLLTLAMGANVIPAASGQAALAATAISMALAPLLVHWNHRIAHSLSGVEKEHAPAADETAVGELARQLDGHAILLGCGRVGRLVAEILHSAGTPYLALETNHGNFRYASGRGLKVILADGSRSRLLMAAGLERARLLVITFDHRAALERALQHARRENPQMAILVSTRDEEESDHAVKAGASVVYPENLAAGLALGARALVMLGHPNAYAESVVAGLRATSIGSDSCRDAAP
jgi:CPA2 family monovalent cation:H+ antiporter-2